MVGKNYTPPSIYQIFRGSDPRLSCHAQRIAKQPRIVARTYEGNERDVDTRSQKRPTLGNWTKILRLKCLWKIHVWISSHILREGHITQISKVTMSKIECHQQPSTCNLGLVKRIYIDHKCSTVIELLETGKISSFSLRGQWSIYLELHCPERPPSSLSLKGRQISRVCPENVGVNYDPPIEYGPREGDIFHGGQTITEGRNRPITRMGLSS